MAHDEVDAHVQRLWRHRGTTVPGPRRGPRGALDLDEILEAAIGLADAGGLAAVSTRTVAARFGKTPMALYAYVGSKEQMLALMQDHASAMPSWNPTSHSLEEDLLRWAFILFDVHMAHPWLLDRGWAQHTQGPNEQDWMERLLAILGWWSVADPAPIVTMLYATVRACAGTAAAYRDLTPADAADWRARAEATRRLIPDFADRYPRSTSMPAAADWAAGPRAGLLPVIRLVSAATSPK
jgi:AcrR family transcriptional regulator